MVETLHPDVYIEERSGRPTIVGISTSTAAFAGRTRRGPTDRLGFVSSFSDYVRQYGDGYVEGFLDDSLNLFFLNGGARAYISRVVGAGAAEATANAPALAGAAAPAVIESANAEPYDLEPAQTIEVSVDGGGPTVFTITATRATRAGAGLAIVDLTGLTLILAIDGGAQQTVTFAGTDTTAALVAAAINNQITGGFASENGGEVDISSDKRGSGSSVEIVGGTALGEIGHSVGTASGAGNVADVDAVTAAELVALLSTLVGATPSVNAGKVRITHDTAGVASTLEITTAPAALGFPAGSVAGVASALLNLLQINAINVGAWGNDVAYTTQRWQAATDGVVGAAATTAVVTDVSRVELGDIIEIDDGSVRHIAHVNDIDIVTRTLTFQPAVGGTPIASGAVVKSASAHRARTALSAAALAGATEIEVANANQFRVGTEVSLADGTTLDFRVVTKVNGRKLTLNAGLSAGFASGTMVVTHHFHLTVIVDGQVRPAHEYLSLQETDTQDYVEVRLSGDGNESLDIKVVDLAPVVATPIEDHVAPVVAQLLAGGADGAAPTDNEFIGTAEPPTGMQLFQTLNQGDVNTIAVPGISTIAVQQALSDMAESIDGVIGQKVVALVEPPLSVDTALEARAWRLQDHNRDTSYSALYFPWQKIRDRLSSNPNATKMVPPSGIMAGVYSRVDTEVGVHEAPANRALLGVLEPAVQISDGQWDLLNPIGVNVIRSFPGRGVRVMGARTLTNTADGRQFVNIRRLLNFDKVSIARALQAFLFRGTQPSLLGQIQRAITEFHRALWKRGALFPENNFFEAQYVKVDEENNPPETRQQAQLFVEVGINPPYPAEAIILSIGLFDGTQSINESLQSSN